MLLLQAIDLIIMLAHKQHLQGCQVGVLLRPHVTGSKGLALIGLEDRQVLPFRHFHMPVGGPQAR